MLTRKWVDEAPDTIFLIRWTDTLGAHRQAITTRKDETDMSSVDPDYEVFTGGILWKLGEPT